MNKNIFDKNSLNSAQCDNNFLAVLKHFPYNWKYTKKDSQIH